MSEQKMREALQECVKGLNDVMLELGYEALRPEFFRACEALRIGSETLAQTADVGLTDDEICKALFNNPMKSGIADEFEVQIARARAVIQAHEAKKAGGE